VSSSQTKFCGSFIKESFLIEKSNFAVRLLPSLHKAARRIAGRENCSVNQLFKLALAEKMAVLGRGSAAAVHLVSYGEYAENHQNEREYVEKRQHDSGDAIRFWGMGQIYKGNTRTRFSSSCSGPKFPIYLETKEEGTKNKHPLITS
jgi:hypothetical protein